MHSSTSPFGNKVKVSLVNMLIQLNRDILVILGGICSALINHIIHYQMLAICPLSEPAAKGDVDEVCIVRSGKTKQIS